MFFFQHPLADLLVGADDLAFIDMLWRDWSPGFDATEELAAAEAVAAGPGPPGGRGRLLPGPPGRRQEGPGARRGPAGHPGRPAAAPPLPPRRRRRLHRRRGGGGGAVHGARQRHGRARRRRRATSSTSSSPRRSTAASSSSSRRDRSAAPARRPRRGREAGLRDLPDRRPRARRAGPWTGAAHGLRAGRPVALRRAGPATTPTSPSPGTTTSRRSPPSSGSATARSATARWAGAVPRGRS